MLGLRSVLRNHSSTNILMLSARSSQSSLLSQSSSSFRYYGSKKKEPSQEEVDDKKDAAFIAAKLDGAFPAGNYNSFYPGDPQRKVVETQFSEDGLNTFRTRMELLKNINNAEHQHGLDNRDYNIANFLSMDDDDTKADIKREQAAREAVESRQDDVEQAKLDADIDRLRAEEGAGMNLEAFSNLITRYDDAHRQERVDMQKEKRRDQEELEALDQEIEDDLQTDEFRAQFAERGYVGEEGEPDKDDDDRDDDDGLVDEDEGQEGEDGQDDDEDGAPAAHVEEEADQYGMEAIYGTTRFANSIDISPFEEKGEFDQATDLLNEEIEQTDVVYTPRVLTKRRLMRVGQHTRVTKGGRINSYSALVLVGNGLGSGGIGYGKGESVSVALKRAGRDAERKAFTLHLFQNRIVPTGLDLQYRSTKIRFYRAGKGRSVIGMIGHKQRFINGMFGIRGVNYRTYGRRGWRAILNVFQYALPDSWINPDELSTVLGKKFVTRETLQEKKLSLANMLTSRIPNKESDPYNYGIIGKFLTDLEQPKDKSNEEFDNMYNSIKEMLKSETSINASFRRVARDPESSQKLAIDPMNKWKRSKYLASKKLEQSRLNNHF
ncbi:hypothetical protein DFA_12258 [Cavenderia fasciculata]|uniref:S5 DRBM domain-containing protein n=1 Tax=Cavenderia fasciculata TaxID=261658 RepID=F4QCW0_CACFS|nr:uncharacterized protein DFA_12258 [Cavenderia fasciculata]EGG14484.1 hypothetical protein DFA_12258 [Cavenderia fasciculata]|eukprot:XP_004353893.1 hypothetical protein DFA_12258 [Cavenderia fasciculata]